MRFAFEDYMLDADRRELTHRSAQVAVGPQVFDLLYYLVRNRERVLSKDDLLQAVWGGRIVWNQPWPAISMRCARQLATTVRRST